MKCKVKNVERVKRPKRVKWVKRGAAATKHKGKASIVALHGHCFTDLAHCTGSDSDLWSTCCCPPAPMCMWDF